MVSPDGQWVGVVEQQAGALVLTSLLNGWINPPGLPGANGWQLRLGDRFLAADLDGDGQAELIVVSPDGQWVGVVEQQAGALVLTSLLNGWINSPGQLGANGWQLRAGDRFLAADLDGDGPAELIVVSPDGQQVGVVEQQAGVLVLTSQLNGWINPPGGGGANGWELRTGDRFFVADIYGGNRQMLVMCRRSGELIGLMEGHDVGDFTILGPPILGDFFSISGASLPPNVELVFEQGGANVRVRPDLVRPHMLYVERLPATVPVGLARLRLEATTWRSSWLQVHVLAGPPRGVRVLSPGTTKTAPYTLVLVANPAIEAAAGGVFTVDPIIRNRLRYHRAVTSCLTSLFTLAEDILRARPEMI